MHSLKRLIIEKTHGNPFFMEEIVRALVEQGVLVRNGATRLTKPLTEIHVPPTVHGILASRIDALSASKRTCCRPWRSSVRISRWIWSGK